MVGDKTPSTHATAELAELEDTATNCNTVSSLPGYNLYALSSELGCLNY